MEQNIILRLVDISKTFPGVKALDKVRFDLKKGEVHALVGENGAGKSTLMNITAGILKSDSGEIELEGKAVHIKNALHANKLGISTVFQELSIVKTLTVAENIYFSRQPVNKMGFVNKKQMHEDTRKLLTLFGIDIETDTIVKQLSIAEQQIIEILKALSFNPKILILDEPTASLTIHETEMLFKVIEKLKESGVGIIYISHHLEEIFRIAERVTVFRDGKYITTLNVKETTQPQIVNFMVGREISDFFCKTELSYHENEPILKLKGVSLKGKFSDISLDIYRGEILGVAGLVGAGRSEVARTLFGEYRMTSGEVEFEGRKVKFKKPEDAIKSGVVYLTEDRKNEGLFLKMQIRENVTAPNLRKLASSGFMVERRINELAENYIKKMRVATPSITRLIKNLSGGNQQKVLLSMWLATEPKVLIIDEPTKGVDVGAKSEIYCILRELADSGVAVVMISSDLPEVLGVSDRIVVMREGSISGMFSAKEASEQNVMLAAAGVN